MADTAFATYFGQLSGPPKIVTVERLDNGPSQEWTVDVVSLSRQ
ncbi:hypothetical protein [Devosia sp.]|nr:hypothetical protein [Devosia sp.]